MTARILVVDDVPANVKLLEARLLAEYFEVFTASGGVEAIETCATSKVDVVLLDVMMPGMDGFEVCRRLKADPATSHIPVVMVTALDQTSDRIRGLEAGADDFLTKPVNDLQLMTRVKSLVRLKTLTDELRLRASTSREIGFEDVLAGRTRDAEARPRVLLVDGRPRSVERIRNYLADEADVDAVADPQMGLIQAAAAPYECLLVPASAESHDPLRLCSQLRSLDRTRFLPVILLAEPGDEDRIIRGLEIGVNDYLVRPIDRQELIARLRTQVRRSRYNDRLRASVTQTIEMAVIDSITGLYNRRYVEAHLNTLCDRAIMRRRPLSIVFLDLDNLKIVNDTHGHAAGGKALGECARLLQKFIRGIDLACRYGGDEFVIVMPDTSRDIAMRVAERICQAISVEQIDIEAGQPKISVTVSVGVASLYRTDKTAKGILDRADTAMYMAKKSGGNRVVGELEIEQLS